MPFSKTPFSTLTLYYHPASPPSRACLMLLRTLNIDVAVKVVDLLAKEQFDEEFVKLNPSHQVPVLVDGDFVLTESRAIMAYIVNSKKPGNSLYPVNSKIRAKVDQLLYFDSSVMFEKNALVLRGVMLGKETKLTEEGKKTIHESVRLLEALMSDDDWLAGQHMTIADISILSIISQLDYCGFDVSKYTKVAAWYERCKSLSCFKENAEGAKMLGDVFKSHLEEGEGF